MFLKRWGVIVVLALVGLALGAYWWSMPSTPDGVTPQGGSDETITAIAALAGAVTTLGGAIFGVLMKFTEYQKAKLDIEERRIALQEKKQSLESK
jgi:hypothetical protein